MVLKESQTQLARSKSVLSGMFIKYRGKSMSL